MERLTPDDLAARVTVFDVDDLTLWEANPNRADSAAIHSSMEEWGQIDTILVATDDAGRRVVVDGNHRVAAERSARRFGGKLAGIDVTGLDWSDVRAFAAGLALNRSARLGEDDPALLTDLLAMVRDEDPALLRAMSYSDDDLTALLDPDGSLGGEGDNQLSGDLDAVPDDAPAITKPGDIWTLGPHRVMAGDCRNPDHVARLLDGAAVNLAFTSPPYASQRTYDETSGFKPIPPDQYVEWFAPVQANVAAHLASDGSWFVNIKAGADGLDTELYVLDLVLAHARRWGWHFATEYCWERNGVPKNVTRRFKNQFEPVYQFALGDWKMRPAAVQHWSENVPIPGGPGVGNTGWADSQGGNAEMFGARKRLHGKHGGLGETDDRQGTNWQPGEFIAAGMAYPGNRLPTFAGTHEATGHTAAFPVGLPQWFIKAYTDPGDTVYDPFVGSGSTILAAHQERRIGYGMEISPKYCDTICARFQRMAGIVPVLESTGKPVSFLTPDAPTSGAAATRKRRTPAPAS